MTLQRLVHAGRPHEGGPACEAVHCYACGKDGPQRYTRLCVECGHGWRWGWLLSLADMQAHWRVGRVLWGLPALPWWRRIRLRRPSRVWVCPCCTHDL